PPLSKLTALPEPGVPSRRVPIDLILVFAHAPTCVGKPPARAGAQTASDKMARRTNCLRFDIGGSLFVGIMNPTPIRSYGRGSPAIGRAQKTCAEKFIHRVAAERRI